MNKNYFTSVTPIKEFETFCFLLVTFFSISISSYGQTTKTFTSSSTAAGTFKVPAGVTSLTSVECWGAGGAGGGATAVVSVFGGGGGGGGAYIKVSTFPVTPATVLNYKVGAGGIGASGSNGGDGEETKFSTVIAKAGFGGKHGNSSNGAGGLGGAAGIGTSFSGGSGGTPGLVGGILASGGGGGSAGIGSNGNNGVLGTGGAEVNGGGAGSGGVLLAGNGIDNTAIGGGGGGAKGLLLSNYKGGKGGDGQIKVIYTCPDYKFSSISASDVCLISGTTSLVKLTGSSLPKGDYVVNYKTSNTSAVLSANTTVSLEGVLEFVATGLNVSGYSTITVTNLTSETCSNDFSTANTVTVKVSSIPVGLGTISGPVNICQGQSDIVYSVSSITNATSYSWSYSGLGATIINNTTATPTIIFASNATSGNLTVYGVNSCGSGTLSQNYAVTVNLRPSAPIVKSIIQPTCEKSTGSVELTGLPAVGTWTINPGNHSGTGTTTTIIDLAPEATYNFTVSYGSCVSLISSDVPINKISTRTWNGAWDVVPTINNKVVFASDYNQNADIEACSCEVKSGAHVTFKTGRYLKLRNELVVSSGGSLTFENNASLIQTNDAAPANSGNINYHRHTAPVRRYDFTYWSSPVVGQTLYDLSPNTLGDKYYRYDPEAGWQISYNGTDSMEKGKGYIIRAPQYFDIDVAAVDYNPVFIGKPNNGVITLPSLAANRVHLLGNPYPSAISADAFIDFNSSVLEGTLYFWTHNSPPSSTVGTFPGNTAASYNYAASDYAIYNKTGGVGTPAVIEGAVSNGGARLTGKIAAGQGFFTPASATGGEIVFNNSMRLSGNTVIDNSQFFKLNDVSKSNAAGATTTIEKNRVWLNLTNEEGAFKQTLIGYITGATNGYEGSFDGISYDGNQYVDFYSINQELNLSIQGRALPFQQKDSVALGYKTAIAGDFKISIDHVDGSMASQKVFLEDKMTQVLHNLKEPYTFTTEKGIFNNRFVLRYEDKNAVIEDISDVAVEGVLISSKNKIINIDTTDEIIKTIHVYDFSGKLMYSDKEVNQESTTISNLSNAAQALIVQVVLENGKKAVKKIIY